MSLDNQTITHELREECEGESIIIKLDDHFRSSTLINFYLNIPKCDSKLINHHQYLQLFKGKELNTHKIPPQLLYRASRDGFSAESFHKCCDDQFKLVIIVKSKDGDLFGGYTTKNLRMDGLTAHVRDEQLFTFRFENEKFYTFRLEPELSKTLYRYEQFYLFAFGNSFWLCEDANINSESGSHQIENYILEECKLPTGSTYFFSQSNLVEDLEVHKIMD